MKICFDEKVANIKSFNLKAKLNTSVGLVYIYIYKYIGLCPGHINTGIKTCSKDPTNLVST